MWFTMLISLFVPTIIYRKNKELREKVFGRLKKMLRSAASHENL